MAKGADTSTQRRRRFRWCQGAGAGREGGGEAKRGVGAGREEDFNEEGEPAAENDVEEEPEKEETIETVKQDLLEVKIKLKSMEEHNNILENKAKEDAAKNESLEQAMEANKQLLDMSEAKVNSLEMDVEEQKEAILGFQDVFK